MNKKNLSVTHMLVLGNLNDIYRTIGVVKDLLASSNISQESLYRISDMLELDAEAIRFEVGQAFMDVK